MKEPSLSVCMIVKNEANDLPRCLESIQGIADQIVIVDTGSQDQTPEIALRFKAALFHFKWQDNFAAARNFSLEQATSDWILVLDADEMLEQGSRATIKSILKDHPSDAIRLRCRNLQPSDDLCQYQDQKFTRLFRNKAGYRFEGIIHEQIAPSILRENGTISDADITVIHFGYARRSVQGSDQRAARNIALLQKAVIESPMDAYLYFQLGITYKMIGDFVSARSHLKQALVLDHFDFGIEILDEIYMKMAQMAIGEDNYALTLQYARDSLKQNPDNLVSLYLMALSYIFQGDLMRAYPLFQRIRQSPGNNLSNNDDLDAVLQYCKQTLGLLPGEPSRLN